MRRAILALFSLAGCMQGGPRALSGATPDPGILPLAPRAASFCRAGRALLTGAPVGFCRPAGAGAPVCGACGPRELCVCGRCAFAACTASADCAPGERCRKGRCEHTCDADTDCAAGEGCREGVCLTACDGGCRPAERCTTGRCEPANCSADADCAAGEACDVVREGARLVEPSVVAVGSGFAIALEERLPTESRIVFGRSTDGFVWEIQAEVFASVLGWEQGAVGAPALFAAGEDVTLYYEGGDGAGIGVAQGRLGAPLVRQPDPLLTPAEAWEEGAVGGPALLPVPGRALLYDAGRAVAASGRACRDDAECLGGLERCRAGRCRGVPRFVAVASFGEGGVRRRVLLTPDDVGRASAPREDGGGPLWAGLSAVFSPGAVTVGTPAGEPLTLLFFAAVGSDLAGGASNRSLGLAISRDGASFRAYPYGPVVARVALLTQSLGESGPWPVPTAAGLRVYFDATDAAGGAQPPALAVPQQ